MSKRNSDDFIVDPAFEAIRKREALAEHMATHTLPTYEVKYELLTRIPSLSGITTAQVLAVCEASAIEQIKRDGEGLGVAVKIHSVKQLQAAGTKSN